MIYKQKSMINFFKIIFITASCVSRFLMFDEEIRM